MSMKGYAFGFALVRFVALVVLALLPTIILVGAYRTWAGRPLWSLEDIPSAAEVVVCLAWVGVLTVAADTISRHLAGMSLWVQFAAMVAAAAFAAIPLALASAEIARLRERMGLATPVPV